MSERAEPALTGDQLDALVEVVNIGFGKAASLIAKLVDSFITMSVPTVERLALTQLPTRLATITSDRPLSVVRQSFRPDFRGEHLFIVEDGGLAVLHTLLQTPASDRAESHQQDGLLEVANIVCGALIGKLSEVIGTRSTFSAPLILAWHEPADRILAGVPPGNDVCLLIHTSFSVEKLPVFRGFVVILLSTECLDWLGRSLDRFASGGT
jgi:chemotaxis protein CheC